MQTLATIKESVRSEMPMLQARFGVERVRVFGSRLHGTARATSDLDLLVDFESVPDLFTFVALRNHLSDRLGMPVDLVTPASLDARLAPEVLRTAEVV